MRIDWGWGLQQAGIFVVVTWVLYTIMVVMEGVANR